MRSRQSAARRIVVLSARPRLADLLPSSRIRHALLKGYQVRPLTVSGETSISLVDRVVRCVSASSPVPGFQRPAMVQPRKRMRQNLPVTQNETTFPDGDTIVSVNDLKGKISHCKPAFVKISGFHTEENGKEAGQERE